MPPDMRGRNPVYPFAEMKVGDSFFLPATEEATPSKIINRISAASATYRLRNNNGFRVAVRSLDGGVRVWRVEDKP
jgi:hypothetical protein